jgi:hypothetical protein
MKPLLLFCLCLLTSVLCAQSLDYISVRKQNGRTVKNFYEGSRILLQLNDGMYLQGPVTAVRNDSVFVTVYDIRRWPTPYGSYVTDTVTTTIVGVSYKNIMRVHLDERRGFFKRMSAPLLMLGGGGYLVLNLLNGAFYDLPITDSKNLRRIGIATGAFGLGFLLNKLFASDGFSKKKHHRVYVNL